MTEKQTCSFLGKPVHSPDAITLKAYKLCGAIWSSGLSLRETIIFQMGTFGDITKPKNVIKNYWLE